MTYIDSFMPDYEELQAPTRGARITRDAQGRPVVPDEPIFPFIEGDGIIENIRNP
jgi:hypothetical protein